MESSLLHIAFGRRVRDLRKNGAHSQEAFAALANMDRSAYGKLERGEGNVGLTSMARIAAALDITLAALLEGVEYDQDEIKALPRSARGPRPFAAKGPREDE